MERFLCPKTGEDQRSFPRLRTIFMSEHTSSPKSNQTYSACQCQWGRGLISILEQISVLRLLKTLYFACSVCQCGEGYSSPRPRPWLRYRHSVPGGTAHSPRCVLRLVCLLRCIIEEFFKQKKLSFGHRSSLNKILVGVPAACYT